MDTEFIDIPSMRWKQNIAGEPFAEGEKSPSFFCAGRIIPYERRNIQFGMVWIIPESEAMDHERPE